MMDEIDEIDIADGISARLEYISCMTDALRDKVSDDRTTGTAVGQLSILKSELDQVLADGQKKAETVANATLERVRDALGFAKRS